jgi:hypothetical protein
MLRDGKKQKHHLSADNTIRTTLVCALCRKFDSFFDSGSIIHMQNLFIFVVYYIILVNEQNIFGGVKRGRKTNRQYIYIVKY